MAFHLVDGKLLIVDGKVAADPNCCCRGCCIGCEGQSGDIAALLVTVDASSATYNPATSCGGDNECCQELTGTFLMDVTTECETTTPFELSCIEDTLLEDVVHCHWNFTEASNGVGMCLNAFETFEYQRSWSLLIEKADDGHYYAELQLIVFRIVGGFVCGTWTWHNDLGTTKPDCSTIFPLTFENAEYTCPDELEEDCFIFEEVEFCTPLYAGVCFYRNIEITVDLP